MRLSFHGGAGTVTGSRFLLEVGSHRYLVDCGLFQGLKELRALNWRTPAFDPETVDHLILTHTHIDHAGYLPRFVNEGFRGPILATPATVELADVLLRDSAKIQEEDAAYANKKGFSKHEKALPLYTNREVSRAMKQFRPVPYMKWQELAADMRFRFIDAGHILGSAMVQCETRELEGAPYRIVFSGDLGRYNMPLHPDPQPLPECDVLIIESTYGNRKHDAHSFEDQIREAFTRTFAGGGVVLIPSFAVGRAQQVTLILRRLMERGDLPEVPIHIDSPMAIDATRIYNKYCAVSADSCSDKKGESLLFPRNVHFHRTVAESKQLNSLAGPRVIISGSGMMTSGRILHHMLHRLPHPQNLLCLVGYQAPGTRGALMLHGAQTVRIHGIDAPVRARFMSIHGLSGHADRDELLRWVRTAPKPPKAIFVVHGELDAATEFAATLRREFAAATFVPTLDDAYSLDPIRGPQMLPRPAGEPILPVVRVEVAPDSGERYTARRVVRDRPGGATADLAKSAPPAIAPTVSFEELGDAVERRATGAPAPETRRAEVPRAGGRGIDRRRRSKRPTAPSETAAMPSAKRPARRVPLPEQVPQLPPGDPEAAERVRRIMESRSYARADQDLALLDSNALRHVRLLLDYLKPELMLQEHKSNRRSSFSVGRASSNLKLPRNACRVSVLVWPRRRATESSNSGSPSPSAS